MKRIRFIWLGVLLSILSFSQFGCIKSSLIGEDILKEDEIGIYTLDDFSIVAKTVKYDSLIGSEKKGRSILLGSFSNDLIGKADAGCYFDFLKPPTIPNSNSALINFDSIVLTMSVDTSLTFSKDGAMQHIEVFELEENLPDTLNKDMRTDLTYQYNTNPIGEISFSPKHIDTLVVEEPEKDSVTYSNTLRVKLDRAFGKKFLTDTTILTDQDLLREKLKGIYIKATPDISSMISLSAKLPIKLEVYYTEEDKLSKMYFSKNTLVRSFEHDYAGSEVESHFDSNEAGENALFIQGMQGTKIEMNISDLEKLKKYNVNKAFLNIYCEKNDDLVEAIPPRILTFYIGDDDKKRLVDDIGWDVNLDFYNGLSKIETINDVEVYKYTLNLTTFIKKMVKKDKNEVNLVLFSSNRISNPGFGKFYGTKNKDLKPKLKVIYTEIN